MRTLHVINKSLDAKRLASTLTSESMSPVTSLKVFSSPPIDFTIICLNFLCSSCGISFTDAALSDSATALICGTIRRVSSVNLQRTLRRFLGSDTLDYSVTLHAIECIGHRWLLVEACSVSSFWDSASPSIKAVKTGRWPDDRPSAAVGDRQDGGEVAPPSS